MTAILHTILVGLLGVMTGLLFASLIADKPWKRQAYLVVIVVSAAVIIGLSL
jgi:hypothetical protein